jgi:hypothetical protein
MVKMINKILLEPFNDFVTMFTSFLPSLLSAIVVFMLGLLLCWFFNKITKTILNMISADKFFHRIGVGNLLEKGGIKETPSALIAKVSYWILVIFFSTLAVYTLNVPAIGVLLQKFLIYLPNFFISVLVIITGFLVSNFVETTVLIASVNSGIKFAKLLSQGVKLIIILLASTMALEQLGIGHDTVLVAFTLVFGGMIFALSLAFGLGGKEIAMKYLEKRLTGDDEESNGIKHL